MFVSLAVEFWARVVFVLAVVFGSRVVLETTVVLSEEVAFDLEVSLVLSVWFSVKFRLGSCSLVLVNGLLGDVSFSYESVLFGYSVVLST